MAKIWLLIHESCRDGEVSTDIIPCKTEEVAKRELHTKAIDIVALAYNIDTEDIEKEFYHDKDYIMEREGDKYFYVTCRHENTYDSLNVKCKKVIE